jgi:hypothetical protein
MASFMNQLLYTQGKDPSYPLKRLVGLEVGLDNSVGKKCLLPLLAVRL